MAFDFSSQINLSQSGVSQIIGAAAMLQPNTPSFGAYRNTAGVFNSGSYFVYDAVTHNIGNGYNPANGLFTAPVAGVYYFFSHCITDNTVAELRHSIYKNGGMYSGGVYIQYPEPGFISRCAGGHVQMAAGDYVGFMMIQGVPNWSGGGYHAIGGYLAA